MNTPDLITIPFANEGEKNTIPDTGSQTDVLASKQLGFPPLTMQLVGGTPPNGKDLNGVLNDIYLLLRYQQCFGSYPYNAAFATAIGGYPKGARVLAADGYSHWVNIIEGNTSDPDNGGTGWLFHPVVVEVEEEEQSYISTYIGAIVLWNSSRIPSFGVLCNGQTLNSTNYPELYTAWYGTYVANQSFKVPNYTGGYYPRGFATGVTQALGARSSAQIPNLKGEFSTSRAEDHYTGPFSRKASNKFSNRQDAHDGHYVAFDASKVSSVYKDGAKTLETNNVATNFIVIAK